jgi:hypothetical protein
VFSTWTGRVANGRRSMGTRGFIEAAEKALKVRRQRKIDRYVLRAITH